LSLRQNVRIGVTRNDEQQIEQNLKALATLVSIYITIDYSNEHDTTKHHASLAAGYLAAAVESVIPHNMPDVLMEGTRLMGQSAQLFLACGDPTDIASIADKIALVACVGIAKEDHRAVTMAAMEQLARLTFNLLRTKNADIAFAAGELKKNVSLIAKLFLAIPENPLLGHTYLGPYYSLTSEQTLPAWLTKLANELIEGEASDEAIRAVIHNIDEWSDELYRTEKELLLAAIEKKSHFTFDVIHWIAHVTKILVAFANAPACDEHTKEEITKHAAWLISVLSWVPDDREAVLFVENFRMTETLFDAALDARVRDNGEVFEAARDMLLSWSSKAGRHRWTILERAIYALATLALWKDDASEAALLTGSIGTALAKENAPEQESRDRAAREIRRTAATLRRRDFAIRRIEHAMNQIDPAKLRPLLQDIANLLSPNTADEPVRREFF
jgi:hypothetical protein